MKTEYVERPAPLKDGLKIIPEKDMDIVNLTRIALKADPESCELKWKAGHLLCLYTSIEELVNVAIKG